MDEEVFQHDSVQFLLRVVRGLRRVFFTRTCTCRRHVHEREEAGFRQRDVYLTAGADAAARHDVHDVLLHHLRPHTHGQGKRVGGG